MTRRRHHIVPRRQNRRRLWRVTAYIAPGEHSAYFLPPPPITSRLCRGSIRISLALSRDDFCVPMALRAAHATACLARDRPPTPSAAASQHCHIPNMPTLFLDWAVGGRAFGDGMARTLARMAFTAPISGHARTRRGWRPPVPDGNNFATCLRRLLSSPLAPSLPRYLELPCAHMAVPLFALLLLQLLPPARGTPYFAVTSAWHRSLINVKHRTTRCDIYRHRRLLAYADSDKRLALKRTRLAKAGNTDNRAITGLHANCCPYGCRVKAMFHGEDGDGWTAFVLFFASSPRAVAILRLPACLLAARLNARAILI